MCHLANEEEKWTLPLWDALSFYKLILWIYLSFAKVTVCTVSETFCVCVCVYVQTYYSIIKLGRETQLHYDQQNDHNDEFIALLCESTVFNSIDFLFQHLHVMLP